MRFLRTQGFLASALGLLAFAGCGGRGDLRTDLRPEGAPEVTTVMVMTDQDITAHAIILGNGGIPEEQATFCRDGDDMVPTVIGTPDQSVVLVCPEDDDDPQTAMVTNATPGGMQIRIVFDELLDTAVETLHDVDDDGPCDEESISCYGTLATTQPVTVMCGNAAVAYDGYYAPNGNIVSWPPGPSLVIQLAPFSVATGATCSVTVKDTFTDKQGEVVPTEQRGPYNWAVAELSIGATSPEDGDDLADNEPAIISFNAPLDPATVTGADITVDDGGGPVAADISVDPGTGDVIITLAGGAPWVDGTTYTVTVLDTATITDALGGAYTGGEFIFSFNAVAP